MKQRHDVIFLLVSFRIFLFLLLPDFNLENSGCVQTVLIVAGMYCNIPARVFAFSIKLPEMAILVLRDFAAAKTITSSKADMSLMFIQLS